MDEFIKAMEKTGLQVFTKNVSVTYILFLGRNWLMCSMPTTVTTMASWTIRSFQLCYVGLANPQ